MEARDLIKAIHQQGPRLQKNPEPGELAKGTKMHEMKLSTPKGDVDQRIHVSHDGSYVHED